MSCLCLDESSCLRLASSLPPLHHLRVFVLPPPRFPCTFPCLLLAVAPVSPHLRLCLPQHLLRTFPRCLLIFLASSFFLPSQPPPFRIFPLRFPMPSYSSSPASSSHFSPLPPYLPCVFLLFAAPAPPRIFPLRFSMPSPCRLYIYPCVLSSSLSHALREKSLCYDSGFSSDRDSFCLVSGKGASLRCVLFSCGRQGGLPPLLGIKSIYIGVNAIFCKKCVFSMKKIGKCLQIQKKSLPLHPHLRNNGSYKV